MDAARRALPHLVECAERRETITYGELGRRIDRNHRTLGPVLGYIRDEICIARGLPLLNTLVVYQHSGLPGAGFLAQGTDHLSRSEYRRVAKAHQQRVFANGRWRSLLARPRNSASAGEAGRPNQHEEHYPLRGTVLRYDEPTSPVAAEDWRAAR